MRTGWIAAALWFAALPCSGQSSRLGASCDLSVLGMNETASFLAFDRELRDALSRQDAGMMALLVRYPLRIDDNRGSWYIDDAQSLEIRFQDIFPPLVRAAAIDEKPGAVWCNYTGVMYRNGTVWANPQPQNGASSGQARWLVETVNVPTPGAARPVGRVQFECETDRHRILIDLDAAGKPHYRDWDKPHSLVGKPDLEITGGQQTSEGTGTCSHLIWRFSSGGARITVQTLGCYEASSAPPQGARGRLEVSGSAGAWCY